MARPLKTDLTGQRLGKLLVIDRAPSRSKHVYWNCLCDCGNTTQVQTFNLIAGFTRSCGCYHSERVAEVNRLRIKRN